MTDCTAKVTTADVTDEVVARIEGFFINQKEVARFAVPEGETVQRQGKHLVRVGLHETGCRGNPGDDHVGLHYNGNLRWPDSLPGATPHMNVTVTDAEVEAAREAYRRTAASGHPSDTVSTGEAMRAALVAAKRAEKEQA